jgi:hypothetical protein
VRGGVSDCVGQLFYLPAPYPYVNLIVEVRNLSVPLSLYRVVPQTSQLPTEQHTTQPFQHDPNRCGRRLCSASFCACRVCHTSCRTSRRYA